VLVTRDDTFRRKADRHGFGDSVRDTLEFKVLDLASDASG